MAEPLCAPSPRPGRRLRVLGSSLREANELLARFDRRRSRELRVTPEFYELDYERVVLRTADGVELAAWWVPPQPVAHRSSTLGVLMHHHYGGQKAAMLPWIELFSRLGLPCLAIDARAHGGSPCRPDQESYRQRFADVHAARDELLRRGTRTILGFGQSQGGAVLIGALAGSPELGGLVLDSGPSATALPSLWGLGRLMLRERSGETCGNDSLTTAVLAAKLYRRTGPGSYPLFLWKGLWRLRDRPLLWLHGTRDEVIEQHRAAKWYDRLRPHAPQWSALTVPGAGHVQCLQHAETDVAHALEQLLERVTHLTTSRSAAPR